MIILDKSQTVYKMIDMTKGMFLLDFQFYMPVKVVSGFQSVMKNKALFKAYGKSALIVTGGSSAEKSGALKDVCTAFEKEGIVYSVFDRVGPNPLVSVCYDAGVAARKHKAAFIVGIGGGSPLDAAKAAAIFAANPQMKPEDIFERNNISDPLPLILIGTTAGTGSEVTAVSVLTRDETGRKRSITDPRCYARLSFADPRYTCSMPLDITISTALDALSHATEGWFSPMCTDVAALFAEKAVRLVWEGLSDLYYNRKLPDETMREKLYYGSLYAGMVLNCMGTAFPHPMGYVLTEEYDIPHGRACASFLPALVSRAALHSEDKYLLYFNWLNTDFEEFQMIVLGLSGTDHIHMTQEQINVYGGRWEKLKNFANTPGGFSRELAAGLLQRLFLDQGR